MRKLLTVVLLLALSVQAAAQESDRTKAENEGKEAAASALKFMKGNMQSFTGSVSGQTKLKTFSGKEYSVSIEKPLNSVDSINLQVRGGDLYVNVPGKISITATAICENGFIYCADKTNWSKCSYYYYDGSAFRTGSYEDLKSCYCISQQACKFTWNDYWLRWALNKVTYMLNLTDRNFVDMVAYPNAIRKFQAVQTTNFTESQLRDTDTLRMKVEQNEAIKAYKSNPYFSSSATEKECTIRNYLNSYGNTLHTKLVFMNGKETKGVVCIGLEKQSPNKYKCFLANNLSPHCGTGWHYRVCGSFGVEWYVPDDVGIDFRLNGQVVKHYSSHTGGDDWQKVKIEDCDLQKGTCSVSCSGYGCFNNLKFAPTDCVSLSIALWNNGGCNGVPRGSFWTYVKETPDIRLYHKDSCGNMGSNCKLKEEWVCFYPPTAGYDGIDQRFCVQTVHNFVRRLSPAPKCWEMRSSQLGQKWRLCMDGRNIIAVSPSGEQIVLGSYQDYKGWSYVKRVYYCKPDDRMSVDAAVRRGIYIREHSFYKGGKVGYSGDVGCAEQDLNGKKVYVCLANNMSYSSISECQANCRFEKFVVVPDSPYQTCKVGNTEGVYLCKVAVPGHQVRIVSGSAKKTGQQGKVSNYTVKETEPNTKVDEGNETTYEFRTCQMEVDGSGKLVPKCPVSGNEKIVKNCYCDVTEEAWKTLATIEMLDEMSHDIICSKE